MKKQRNYPFNNLTPEAWLNLALFFTLLFYIVRIITIILLKDMCINFGGDYCAYWPSGKIIREEGFANIYNTAVQAKYQIAIHTDLNHSPEQYIIVGVPYLPIFVLPFLLLSFLALPSSYLVWTLINFVGLIFYLRFFLSKIGHEGTKPHIFILMALLSLMVFKNFLFGQFNVLLAICAGEFLRATINEKSLKAGIWLGGWLLKPQLLILILPLLLIRKAYKTLAGFIVSASVIFAISFSLVGLKGFTAMIDEILYSSGGLGASNPQLMMNWRMIGLHLATITSSAFGLIVTIIGSLLTIGILFFFIIRKPPQNKEQTIIELLGLMTATCLATWHSHSHMGIILIPPLIYLSIKYLANKTLLLIWMYVPAAINLFALVILTIFSVETSSFNPRPLSRFLIGLSGFALNAIYLIWVIKRLMQSPNELKEIFFANN